MTVTSGRYARVAIDDGSVTAVVECTGWSVSKSTQVTKYASCSTGGYMASIAGSLDISGTISGMFDPDSPIESQLNLGDLVTLQLHYSALKGHELDVIIVSGPDYTFDVKSGEAPEWTAQWALRDANPEFNITLDAIP